MYSLSIKVSNVSIMKSLSAGDNPSSWVPTDQVKDSILGTWLLTGPAVVHIWGIDQWMEDLSVYMFYCVFFFKK